MARVEDVEPLPAPLDDEPIRQRPLHLQQGLPGGQVVRIGRQGARTIQVPDVLDPVVLRQ